MGCSSATGLATSRHARRRFGTSTKSRRAAPACPSSASSWATSSLPSPRVQRPRRQPAVATSPRRIAASQWMPRFTNAIHCSNDGSNDFSRRRLPGHGQELPVPLPYHAHMQAPAPAHALAGLGWEVSPSGRRASSTTPAAKPSNAPGAARAAVPHQSQHRDGADLQGLASCARS